VPAEQAFGQPEPQEQPSSGTADGAENAYVTPLVRKLAAEHGIDLATIAGTGVGGRIRKQDVLEAARAKRGDDAPGFAQTVHEQAPQPAQAGPAQADAVEPPAEPAAQAPAVPAQAGPAPAAPAQVAAPPAAPPAPPAPPAPAPPAPPAPAPAATAVARPQAVSQPVGSPSAKRGTTERLSRARQVIAQRMVESLQTSAQLTTVVEADVTAIARLRDRAKAGFEAREGVKLSFLPFFALAAIEALKVHPTLNAVIDTANGTVTYHDAEHLGIAVDTERGLMVPVIRNAGDLNIAGLARKIADLAQRTRAGQVNPDDLSGGTFTLTNTGSRGALFDTPIINQPQVGILGTGTVNKRAVVVDDPDLGEVITVRSIVYLSLTYDHRLVDGADAARFLVTVKNRLQEGAFESELGH
jgi:2-oxoglutarate dehydrogenase E2 component (dihydrolipoamide succinyltransferase)